MSFIIANVAVIAVLDLTGATKGVFGTFMGAKPLSYLWHPRPKVKYSKVSKYSTLRKALHRYLKSHVMRNHTVLPATRQRWLSRINHSRS